MNKIVFDIETKNTFQQVGTHDASMLDLSLVGIYDYTRDVYETFLEEELPDLWPILATADLLIGYNSDHFDIPLLNKYYPEDLKKIKSLDLLKEIRVSLGRRVKLDYVANGTLGTKKSGNGLDAIQWWKDGEIEKIKKYCLDDVRITKEIYEHAMSHNQLRFIENGETFVIPLSTSNWEPTGNTDSQLSLF